MEAQSSIRELNPHGVPGLAGGEQAAGTVVYRFGDFALDTLSEQVSCGGARVELRPCTYQLLTYLVANAGRVVSRSELFDQIWPDVSVSDGALTQSIWEVRRALGEAGREQRFIRTVRGSGYCFAALVRTERPQRAAEATHTRPCMRPPPPERPVPIDHAVALAPNPVTELSRVLHARVRSASGSEHSGTLLAAYEDLIAVAQRPAQVALR